VEKGVSGFGGGEDGGRFFTYRDRIRRARREKEALKHLFCL